MDQPVRWPAPPLSRPPARMRAIYVNAWAFGGRRFHELVRLADRTEINAFVMDVKDDTGYLTYRSEVPTAIQIGANQQLRARDIRDRLRIMREHGIIPIARIVVAKDPLLASKQAGVVGAARERRSLAGPAGLRLGGRLQRLGLGLRGAARGRGGAHGLRGGAVRLRPVPRRAGEPAGERASFPAAGRARPSGRASTRNLRSCGDRTRSLGVPFTIDVFGLTTSATTDMGIGQYWEDLVTTADVVLPMVYPSHYMRGVYNLKHPNSEPYQVIRRAMQDALAPVRAARRRRRRSGPTSRRSPWASLATRPPWCGSRSAPRRSWGWSPGCSGTRGAPTTLRSSAEETASVSVAPDAAGSPDPGTN